MIPKSALNSEAEKEIGKIKETEDSIDREINKSNKYLHDFTNFQTIRTFGKDINKGEITLQEADEDQSDLLNSIRAFKNKTRPQNDTKKTRKRNCS